MTRQDIRSVVRGLFLAAAIVGLALALGYALEWAAAAGVVTTAVLMARGSLRVLHPLFVPTRRAAFPDPPRDEWGAVPGAAPSGGVARQPPATHTG